MEAKLILTCRECGHVERGNGARAFITKVRMLNHLNREHSELVEPFKETVEEKAALSH